jgi:glycosyltransferase involved in cell wall biosynthesis
MRIGIDSREISRPNTGTGMYVVNLIKSLAKIDRENYFFLLVESGTRLDEILPSNFIYIDIKVKIFSKIQDQLYIPIVLVKYKIDIYHVTHHDVTPFLTRIPLIITVLDVAWIDFPGESSKFFQTYYYYLTKLSLKKAKNIVTISESTKERVIEHFPNVKEKTESILIACDPFFCCRNDEDQFQEISREFGLKKPYVLYVGSFALRKNIKVLIKAMENIWLGYPNTQLVLAGNLSGKNDENILKLKGSNSIVLISRSKSKLELNSLYQNALVFVFPSIYEGFGLPVLEAMTCGCPVIASNTTSIPEIVGEGQILFNPHDYVELERQLIRVIQDENLINKMKYEGLERSKLFNWNFVASETLKTYLN